MKDINIISKGLTINLLSFMYYDIVEELDSNGIISDKYIKIFQKGRNDLDRHIFRTTRHIVREHLKKHFSETICLTKVFEGIKNVIIKFYIDNYENVVIYPNDIYWECIQDELKFQNKCMNSQGLYKYNKLITLHSYN
jgi:hypothetical protein